MVLFTEQRVSSAELYLWMLLDHHLTVLVYFVPLQPIFLRKQSVPQGHGAWESSQIALLLMFLAFSLSLLEPAKSMSLLSDSWIIESGVTTGSNVNSSQWAHGLTLAMLRLSTFFSFLFLQYWGLTLGLHLEPLHQPYFCEGFFKLGSCELFAWVGFNWDPLISAS
jgi:hypothetical protein